MRRDFAAGFCGLLAVTSVAGCLVFEEGDSDPAPSPTPTATPSATPSPTPVSFVVETLERGYSDAQVDVLLVIDNTGSMQDSHTRLANACSSFFAGASGLDLDLHFGVITTDTVDSNHSGKLQGSPAFLETSTPNAVTLCESRVLVGIMGSAPEAGLRAAQLALSAPLTDVGNSNAGFFRDEAALAVVFVSDEDDASPGTWTDYVPFLAGLKADPSHVHITSIVGPSGGCTGTGETATDGERYRLLASSFGGIIADICSADLTDVLADVRKATTARAARFELEYTPIAESIEVAVDGVVTTSGLATWAYVSTANALVFTSGALPAACAELTIAYDLAAGQNVTDSSVEHPADPFCP